MFDSLLVANRGEIACRIIRTARKMGLRTIAVFSEADRDALHVRMADQAVAIGPAPARESYLCTDKILEAARLTGAQAIHPGYGFLSEQPDLVEGCTAEGLVWVGPHLDAITSMGSKIAAKKIALKAGVPCIPGYAGEDQSDAALVAAAHEIGLPVMVKASAGGGGKGMRAVFEPIDLEAAIRAARIEAARSFGDDRLLVEKLVRNPRHVEVQLLGDKHGNVIHLFERDCSVQRNHQKILEEAPAPNLTEATREALFEAAVGLGRKIGYDSTGTVEFVMDAATGEFFFLEMNTRLQVEHTVTEEVTGLDLVELQLRVAAGEPLGLTQDRVTCVGHAIEARLTAEDASDGFRPETGTILKWQVPENVRCDSGVGIGSIVGSSYDSMIAKLIALGPDREAARRKLIAGLERTEVAGLRTTRQFLRDALQTKRFQAGEITTDFLRQEWREAWRQAHGETLLYAVLAHHLAPLKKTSPWQTLGGFRLLERAGRSAHAVYVDAKAPENRISIQREAENRFVVGGTSDEERLAATWLAPGALRVERNGVQETIGVLISDGSVHVWSKDFDAAHQVVQLGNYDAAQHQETTAAPDRIAATMPGLVVNVLVEQGAAVAAGETLVVMESMKLLMELKALAAGTVASIRAVPGDSVEAGALLVQLELDEGQRG
ncbi:acetyl/propionyl/methylcrotonyl-CoA carboxylase subunit alpha [Roseibium sp. SCP14]|uniref:acetyl/propionyl/methylcrotonyl-CoA carboxylase subunit alpha n=1 Tax=Roseibium sp. SCP14 TaxID=3141375 RepID=UPI00333B2794